MNVDVDLLRKQRDLILSLIGRFSGPSREESDLLEGLVDLLDYLLDKEDGTSRHTGKEI